MLVNTSGLNRLICFRLLQKSISVMREIEEIRQSFMVLFLASVRLKRRSKVLQVRFARSASPTCKYYKSDLQIF